MNSLPKRGKKQSCQRRPWSKEEDDCLISLVEEHGEQFWEKQSILLSKYMITPLGRAPKQLIDRWYHYLKPGTNFAKFQVAEEFIFIGMHTKYGNNFTSMYRKLRGRSVNTIKNYFYGRLNTVLLYLEKPENLLKSEMTPMIVFRHIYILYVIMKYIKSYEERGLRKIPFPSKNGRRANYYFESTSMHKLFVEQGVTVEKCTALLMEMKSAFRVLTYEDIYMIPPEYEIFEKYVESIAEEIKTLVDDNRVTSQTHPEEIELLIKNLLLYNNVLYKNLQRDHPFLNMCMEEKKGPNEIIDLEKKSVNVKMKEDILGGVPNEGSGSPGDMIITEKQEVRKKRGKRRRKEEVAGNIEEKRHPVIEEIRACEVTDPHIIPQTLPPLANLLGPTRTLNNGQGSGIEQVLNNQHPNYQSNYAQMQVQTNNPAGCYAAATRNVGQYPWGRGEYSMANTVYMPAQILIPLYTNMPVIPNYYPPPTPYPNLSYPPVPHYPFPINPNL